MILLRDDFASKTTRDLSSLIKSFEKSDLDFLRSLTLIYALPLSSLSLNLSMSIHPPPPLSFFSHRELNLHFLAVEQHAFTLDMPDYLHMMHSPVTQEAALSSCSDTLVSRLFTVCVTLSERPIIR